MEEVLNQTKIEMIALSRPLLRGVRILPAKLSSGETTVAACISCNACYLSVTVHNKAFQKGLTGHDVSTERAD